MWLNAPYVMTTDGNQYSFMQGAIKVLIVLTSSPASSFVVETHDEYVRVNWPTCSYLSRSACAIDHCWHAPRLCWSFYARIFIRKKRASLAVLLRIKQKLMNIDCRLLKSWAAMTAQWGLGYTTHSATSGQDGQGHFPNYIGSTSVNISHFTHYTHFP